MTITIEPFPRDNLADGSRLYRTVFNEPPWNDEWTAESARTRLSQIVETPGYRGYSASIGGELVGLVLGTVEQWYAGAQFYLKEMCVRPAEQRRGIGTMLVEHLLEALRNEDIERVYLLTMRDSPARTFYADRGFELDEGMRLQSIQIGS